MKREAQFQTKFNQWVRTQFKKTAAFELKQCDERFYFPSIQDHQVNGLITAKHGVLAYKVPDDTRSYKPFDSVALAHVPAYVVILYSSKQFYLIDIDAFIGYRDTPGNRSLKEIDAGAICSYTASLYALTLLP